MYNDFILIEDNIMSILEETRIAVDVYRYTTLEDQELILNALKHENEHVKDSESGLIIVRWIQGNYAGTWSEIQIIDKEEIYL
jgi:hypothetical protein